MFHYVLSVLALIILLTGSAEAREKAPCGGKDATIKCLTENFDEVFEKSYINFQIIIGFAEGKAMSCASVDDTAAYLDIAPKIKHNLEVEEYFKEFLETKFVKTNTECLLNALLKVSDDSRKTILGNYLRNPFGISKEDVDKALSPFRTNAKFKDMLTLYFVE